LKPFRASATTSQAMPMNMSTSPMLMTFCRSGTGMTSASTGSIVWSETAT
jgi:hypothetical protein